MCAQALTAFMKVLDGYTLESLTSRRLDMAGLFDSGKSDRQNSALD
jgi:Rrf2 family nitric oxide-sensitive transcriptional repressor